VDTEALEAKVKHIYREVAERPGRDFHFELGKKVALRVGYEAERLATVPAEAVDSLAGVGFFFDRAWFEPCEGELRGRRSRACLQPSKGPTPQAWHLRRDNRRRPKTTSIGRQPARELI
jgi:hypothetical protein